MTAPRLKNPALRVIADEVCASRGLDRAGLLGKGKARHLSIPRQELMFFALVATQFGWSDIGRHLDRHHSTIMHGVAATAQRANSMPAYAADLDGMGERIRAALGSIEHKRRLH